MLVDNTETGCGVLGSVERGLGVCRYGDYGA